MLKGMRRIFSLVKKDLLIEWRAHEFVVGGGVLGLSLLALFRFGGESSPALGFWITVFLVSLLGMLRVSERDLQEGGGVLLRLSPVSGSELFLARFFSLFVLVGAVEVLFAIPLVFFNEMEKGGIPFLMWGTIAAAVAVGFSAVGSLMSAIAVKTSSREIVMPMLILPLVSPLFIGGACALSLAFAGEGWMALAGWLRLIFGFDLILGVTSWVLYDFVIEID